MVRSLESSQIRRNHSRPKSLTDFSVRLSGKSVEIDGWAIGSIARRAGAPYDKSAGVDILRHVGDSVAAGDPLFAIHSSTTTDLDEARKLAESDSCFIIA